SFLFGVGCGERSVPPMNDEKVPAGSHGQVLEWIIIPAAEREGDRLARNREGLRCASEGALRRCEDQDHRAVVSHDSHSKIGPVRAMDLPSGEGGQSSGQW